MFLAHIYIIIVKIILTLVKTMTHIRHCLYFGRSDKFQDFFFFFMELKRRLYDWLEFELEWVGVFVNQRMGGPVHEQLTEKKNKKLNLSQMTVICLMSIGQVPLRWSKTSHDQTFEMCSPLVTNTRGSSSREAANSCGTAELRGVFRSVFRSVATAASVIPPPPTWRLKTRKHHKNVCV